MVWRCFGAIGTGAAYVRWRISQGKLKRLWSDCWHAHENIFGGGGMMSNPDREEHFFKMFGDSAIAQGEGAPSSLKAKVYTALIGKQQESGPLMDLQRTK